MAANGLAKENVMKPYDTSPDRFDRAKNEPGDATHLVAMAGLDKSHFETVAETHVPTDPVSAIRRARRLEASEAVGLGGY
jgi:hypothetical protein